MVTTKTKKKNTKTEGEKKYNPGVRWTLTWHHPPENWVEILNGRKSFCHIIAAGFEYTKKKVPHIQRFFYLNHRSRPSTFWQNLDADKDVFPETSRWHNNKHWEPAYGSTERNRKYCTKEVEFDKIIEGVDYIMYGFDDRVTETIEAWTPEIQPKDFFFWQRTVYEMIQFHMKKEIGDFRKVIWLSASRERIQSDDWIHKTCGSVGKTVFCKFLKWRHSSEVCIIDQRSNYEIEYRVITHKEDYKKTPSVIVVDIPRNMKYADIIGGILTLEKLRNIFFTTSKYKGGWVNGPRAIVLVFSNEIADAYIPTITYDKWVFVTLPTTRFFPTANSIDVSDPEDFIKTHNSSAKFCRKLSMIQMIEQKEAHKKIAFSLEDEIKLREIYFETPPVQVTENDTLWWFPWDDYLVNILNGKESIAPNSPYPDSCPNPHYYDIDVIDDTDDTN